MARGCRPGFGRGAWISAVVAASLIYLLAAPLPTSAVDAQAAYDDIKQKVSSQVGAGQEASSERAREALTTAQKQMEDLKKKSQQQGDPSLWDNVKDSVNEASEGASQAYASATSGGKTKTAYQTGKDGVASASAFASDVGNAAGEQAEALKRAATGTQKSAWQKAKDMFGGSGLFVHAEAAPSPAGQAYENAKDYAASVVDGIRDKVSGYGSHSARAAASDSYYKAVDSAHIAYDKAVKAAQSQYASASKSGGDAGKKAEKAYSQAVKTLAAKRDSAHETAQQAWDKASQASSDGADSAASTYNSAVDSARSSRDKAYKQAQAGYDRAVRSADSTQADAAKSYDSAVSSARKAYAAALAKAESAYDKAAKQASEAGRSASNSASDTYDSMADRASSSYESIKQGAKKTLDGTAEGASQAYDSASKGASRAYDATADTASKAYDATADTASATYDKTAELADEASKKLSSAFSDYSSWSAETLEGAQTSMREAALEVANFVNSKSSKPTSSTEQAYNKAKKTLDSNLKAAQARVSKALGITTKEADSQWGRLSKQWDSASASTKKTLNSQWGAAQKSQKNLAAWLSESTSSLSDLYSKAADEADQQWAALKKVSSEAAGKSEL